MDYLNGMPNTHRLSTICESFSIVGRSSNKNYLILPVYKRKEKKKLRVVNIN